MTNHQKSITNFLSPFQPDGLVFARQKELPPYLIIEITESL